MRLERVVDTGLVGVDWTLEADACAGSPGERDGVPGSSRGSEVRDIDGEADEQEATFDCSSSLKFVAPLQAKSIADAPTLVDA